MTGLTIQPIHLPPPQLSARPPVRQAVPAGSSQATMHEVGGVPSSLVFAVGTAGENLGPVTVTIKDIAGCTVATLALSALNGTQTLIWRPTPGMAAGAYAAYWEGQSLASGGSA